MNREDPVETKLNCLFEYPVWFPDLQSLQHYHKKIHTFCVSSSLLFDLFLKNQRKKKQEGGWKLNFSFQEAKELSVRFPLGENTSITDQKGNSATRSSDLVNIEMQVFAMAKFVFKGDPTFPSLLDSSKIIPMKNTVAVQICIAHPLANLETESLFILEKSKQFYSIQTPILWKLTPAALVPTYQPYHSLNIFAQSILLMMNPSISVSTGSKTQNPFFFAAERK
jgi:hypothetical protein